MPNAPCTQISIGRFHHFHLARQLEKRGLLNEIYTGYPSWKLKDEKGITTSKIHTFPWLQAAYMARGRIWLDRWAWLNREWAWLAQETLDLYVANQLTHPQVLIALSGSGFYAGRRIQALGGFHVCDRGSTHIAFQDQLLHEEYQRYGLQWEGIDPRSIAKEESEYNNADFISVPSQFCLESFLQFGISPNKLLKIPYGANYDRFFPVHPISEFIQTREFQILFVGHAGVPKEKTPVNRHMLRRGFWLFGPTLCRWS